MSRPTVTVVSAKGEATKDTVTVPNVFKVSSATALPIRETQQTNSGRRTERELWHGEAIHSHGRIFARERETMGIGQCLH
jgi:hypothetical protein